MDDEQIKQAVNRFLAWKLPAGFNPDGGISFSASQTGSMPTGTNLFTATQAEAMLRHALDIEKDDANLLRCPFCASTEVEVVASRTFYVRCTKCGVRTDMQPTKALAIAAWQQRPIDTGVPKQSFDAAFYEEPLFRAFNEAVDALVELLNEADKINDPAWIIRAVDAMTRVARYRQSAGV